jgi:hypothetical protein
VGVGVRVKVGVKVGVSVGVGVIVGLGVMVSVGKNAAVGITSTAFGLQPASRSNDNTAQTVTHLALMCECVTSPPPSW